MSKKYWETLPMGSVVLEAGSSVKIQDRRMEVDETEVDRRELYPVHVLLDVLP